MRTCSWAAESPWDLINHLLKCRDTSKAKIECRDCSPAHEVKSPVSPVQQAWRRLSGLCKHDTQNIPSLSLPRKRSEIQDINDDHGIKIFEKDTNVSDKICELNHSLECLDSDAHYNGCVMSERSLRLHTSSLHELAQCTPPAPQIHAPVEALVHKPSSKDLSTSRLSPSWPLSTLHPMTARQLTPDISGAVQAPWDFLGPRDDRAVKTDVRCQNGKSSIISQPDAACIETDFRVCRRGVTHRNYAGSSGSSQTNWDIPGPLATPIRTVTNSSDHIVEKQRRDSFDDTPNCEDSVSASPTSPLKRRDSKVVAATEAVSTQGQPQGPLRRRNAVRSNKPRLKTLGATVSEDNGLSSASLGQVQDGRYSVSHCKLYAKGKRHRRTHLKRYMKIYQTIESPKCIYKRYSSTFVNGREDNFNSHVAKVHCISSESTTTSLTSANIQQTSSLEAESSISWKAMKASQDATSASQAWEEENGTRYGLHDVSMPFNRRFDILDDVRSNRDAQPGISQTFVVLPLMEEAANSLHTSCTRPPLGDLPTRNDSWLDVYSSTYHGIGSIMWFIFRCLWVYFFR